MGAKVISELEWRYCFSKINIPREQVKNILLSYHEPLLEELVRDVYPGARIDYIVELDVEAFLRERFFEDIVSYDLLFDNGILLDAEYNAGIIKALQHHLTERGEIYSICEESKMRGRAKKFFEQGFEQVEEIQFLENDHGYSMVKCWEYDRYVVYLQSFYTPELRRRLAYLLQRLEFDICTDETVLELRELVKCEGITVDYLEKMLSNVTFDHGRIRKLIGLQG